MSKQKPKSTNVAGMEIVALPIASLSHITQRNPNVMSPAQFELLKKVIDKRGFLQPVVVYPDGDAYVLADGEHRVQALTELGHANVAAVVARDAADAREVRMFMNRLRGELDLGLVADDMIGLLEDGYAREDRPLTGFEANEWDSLIDFKTTASEDDLLSGTNLNVSDDSPEKTYNIVLKFDSESKRARVKEALMKYGDEPGNALAQVLGVK